MFFTFNFSGSLSSPRSLCFLRSLYSILSSSQTSLSYLLFSIAIIVLPLSIWTTIKPTIVLYLFFLSDPTKTPTFLSFDMIDKNIESQIFWVGSFYCLISPMIRTWVFWVKVKWFEMKLGQGEMGFLGCCKNSTVLGCSGGWCCCASGWIVVGSWSVLSDGERKEMREKYIYIYI